MRVRISRSGGFAGIVRTAEVDDDAEAEAIAERVREAVGRTPDGRVRDGFVYEFVVISVDTTETYDLSPAQLDDDLAARLRRLF